MLQFYSLYTFNPKAVIIVMSSKEWRSLDAGFGFLHRSTAYLHVGVRQQNEFKHYHSINLKCLNITLPS